MQPGHQPTARRRAAHGRIALKADPGRVDNARLQLPCTRAWAPIAGRWDDVPA